MKNNPEEIENCFRKATLKRLAREARGEKIRTDCFKCGYKYVDEIKLECPSCKYNFLNGEYNYEDEGEGGTYADHYSQDIK